MRIVFMGTPDFAAPSLRTLQEAGHQIVGVFTQPDRPAGRGNKIKKSEIKILAESLNLSVFQPLKIKASESVELLKMLQPECIVVVAFGQVLSKEILELPPYGCVNVHASLLPKYRGAAPIHWAILNGESKTGVTTMLMDEDLDTGDMLLSEEYEISSAATTGEVHDALAKMGAELLLKTIQGLAEGRIMPIPQPREYSYAPLLRREHEKIDWSWSASIIHNRIRGLNPWPGAFTFFRGEQVKIWQSKLAGNTLDKKALMETLPGEIISLTEKGFKVQTGEGILEITELQPAGKKKMAASDFFNGRRIKNRELFE